MEKKLVPQNNYNFSALKKSFTTIVETKKKPDHKYFMVVIGTPINEPISNLDYKDPLSEDCIKNIKFEFFEQDKSKKKEFYEDFTYKYVEIKYTKEQFIQALFKIINSTYNDDNKSQEILDYFQNTLKNNSLKEQYFIDQNLSKDEAYCCALVLSYYTGKNSTSESDELNRRASAVLRFGGEESLDMKNGELEKDFIPIYYYILKALSYIPFYWGLCIRAADLEDNCLDSYNVGSIISWVQFSSSTSRSDPPEYFKKRNTYFYIYSYTGRKIKQFSNFQNEDEVLLLPYTTFLVCRKEVVDNKIKIYLRQVELGFQRKTIFWVDDEILNEKWENKSIMEKVSALGLQKNIGIIAKINTQSALLFLESNLGQNLKADKGLIFISDMNRKNEKNQKEAGAIFVKALRKLGFEQNIMIYTSNEEKANALITDYMKDCQNLNQNIFITAIQKNAIEFLRKTLNIE